MNQSRNAFVVNEQVDGRCPSLRPLQGVTALALILVGGGLSPAHAQTSQVTIYGVVDLGFVRESGGKQGAVNKVSSGMSAGSRLGFTGQEDLGAGMKAFFTLEAGLNPQDGSFAQGGLAFGRQALVGLSNPWGTLTLGRQYTPAALVQVEMDPFNTGLAGTSANLLSPGGAGGSNRMNNTVKYNSPVFGGGFVTELAYGFGGVADNINANSQRGGMFGYVNGPLAVKLAYHDTRDATGNSGKVTWLAARYAFDAVTAYANYVVNKGDSVVGVSNPNSHDVLLGAAMPWGTGRLIASYIKKTDDTAAGNSPSQIALGYIHYLSKRTSLYGSFAYLKESVPNTNSGFYTVGNANYLGSGASGNRALNFGIRHNF